MIRDLAAIRLADMNSWLGQEFCGVEQSTSEKLRKLHPWIDSYERLIARKPSGHRMEYDAESANIICQSIQFG